MPPAAVANIVRDGRAAVVHLRGDLIFATAPRLYQQLRTVMRQRNVRSVVLDFTNAGRVDSSGVAVVSLLAKHVARAGKTLELTNLDDHQRAALALLPEPKVAVALEVPAGVLERLGAQVLEIRQAAVELGRLIIDILRQGVLVAVRKKRLPAGSVTEQISRMGVEAVFIVSLLSFLLGMTMAFQGAVQLKRFGAGVFVSDMIGMSVVREIGPLMTAIILTGRTGAAIAAELGTMRVRSEIDALATMGINPVRFLILPRMIAITIIGPALSLMSMFVGIAGGTVVATLTLDLSPSMFWARLVDRLEVIDFGHGMLKSLMFAWIIGLTASHLGLRTGSDASSVGHATTRTVVVSILFIIIVDALFATIGTVMKHS